MKALAGAGRYAPSPTGDLHLGNLRTALISWAAARTTDRHFYLRLEDLDRGRARDPQGQLDDLLEMGIDWDGEVVVQSERLDRYQTAITHLQNAGLVFECFCSRRDIREATSASHGPPGTYPQTCLHLSDSERETRREALAANGRKPALRLRPRAKEWSVQDMYKGSFQGPIDQVVLQRGDGEYAYNLAVVVDDIAMGIDQIVRGDDLLTSAPIHSYLSHELGGGQPTYGHVPLVLGPTGKRLAKRDGAVTLHELREQGVRTSQIIGILASSLGMSDVENAQEFRHQFSRTSMPATPWIYDAQL